MHCLYQGVKTQALQRGAEPKTEKCKENVFRLKIPDKYRNYTLVKYLSNMMKAECTVQMSKQNIANKLDE